MAPALPSRRQIVLGVLALLSTSASTPRTRCASAAPGGARARPRIAVQPFGEAPPALAMSLAERAIEGVYAFEAVLLRGMPLPKSAFYAPRQRYRAEALLEALSQERGAGFLDIVGVTARDISTTKPPHADWGVVGLANIGGPSAVVSSFRCARRARSPAHAAERFAKAVVHELGHALGLSHCTVTEGCLMEDAGGSVLTTDRETDLCPPCREKLLLLGYALGESRAPWVTPSRYSPP